MNGWLTGWMAFYRTGFWIYFYAFSKDCVSFICPSGYVHNWFLFIWFYYLLIFRINAHLYKQKRIWYVAIAFNPRNLCKSLKYTGIKYLFQNRFSRKSPYLWLNSGSSKRWPNVFRRRPQTLKNRPSVRLDFNRIAHEGTWKW